MNHTQYVSTLLGLTPSAGARSLLAAHTLPRPATPAAAKLAKRAKASAPERPRRTPHSAPAPAPAPAHTPRRKRAPDLDATHLRQVLETPKRVRREGGRGGGVVTLREALLARHQQRLEQRRHDAHSLIVSADTPTPHLDDLLVHAHRRDDTNDKDGKDEAKGERASEEEAAGEEGEGGEAYTLMTMTVRGEGDALATHPRAFTLVSATPAPLRPPAAPSPPHTLHVLPWEEFAQLSPRAQQRHYAALVEAATRGAVVHADTNAPFS